MSEYDVLAHGDSFPAVPMPAAEPAEPAVAPEKPADAEPDFEALIERERERLQDAEAELDRVLTETVWDGMGKTIARAEEAVAIARRRIRSLELRRQSAADTADAKREAARRQWIEGVAAEVDDTITELAERCRVFVESVETAKGALRDAAALADKVRLQRRSVRLRCNNSELAAFEQGRSLPTFGLMALLEKTIAVNVLDLATAFPGAAPHIGVTRNVVTLTRPLPRDFTAPLARARRGFAIDPDVALRASGKFGGAYQPDDGDAD